MNFNLSRTSTVVVLLLGILAMVALLYGLAQVWDAYTGAERSADLPDLPRSAPHASERAVCVLVA
ncbi:MAG: hypothetical protein H6529_11160 [Nocardioides sp.]|nr:hypothetical protein [Nocardioides sp.]